MKSTRSAYDGSATSQPPVTLPLASSTPEASPTCNPTMFDNTDKHTFLPESEVGLSPCNWQDGRQMLLFGPEAALANRFRAPESKGGKPMNGTSGPLGSDLSASAALQSSLASRLHQRMDSNGSMEYSLTWKTRVTPAGRPICALRASGRRISGKGCTGWPSPKAQEDGRTLDQYEQARLRGYENRKGKTSGGPASKQGGLAIAAQLTGWPTPDASAMNDGESLESFQARQAVLKTKYANGNGAGMPIAIAAQLTGWATPQNCDGRGATGPASNYKDLGRDALLSSAATARRGVLDAAFSRWLMQFPESWDRVSPGFAAWQKMQGAIASGACAGMETPCASP